MRQVVSLVVEMKDEIKALKEQGVARAKSPQESNVGAAMGSAGIPQPVPPLSRSQGFMPLQSKAPPIQMERVVETVDPTRAKSQVSPI